MATYLEIYSLWTSADLKKRVYVAVAKKAQYILIEPTGTTNHVNRVQWAKEALSDPGTKADQMLWCIVGDATIQSHGEASTDAEIQYVVDVSIDIFATG